MYVLLRICPVSGFRDCRTLPEQVAALFGHTGSNSSGAVLAAQSGVAKYDTS